MTANQNLLTREPGNDVPGGLGVDELEDLPGFLDNITFTLETDGALLIPGVLEGNHLSMDTDGGLAIFNALIALAEHPIVYVDARYWDANQIASRRERLTDDDLLTPKDIATATAALNASEAHLGEVATLTLTVMAGGVAHGFNFRAGWFLATQPSEAAAQEREDRWEARVKEQDQERARVNTILEGLADLLVADDTFLKLASEGTRRVRANEIAKPLIGADLMVDQRVRGAIAQAVRVASVRRTDEIIPARTEALHDQIPQLAAQLRTNPDFQAATTSKARERAARDLLNSTDPVVPPVALVAPLLAAALAPPPTKTLDLGLDSWTSTTI